MHCANLPTSRRFLTGTRRLGRSWTRRRFRMCVLWRDSWHMRRERRRCLPRALPLSVSSGTERLTSQVPSSLTGRDSATSRALGWDVVDPDIVQHVGEGGAEFRTLAPLHTTASWHHPGVVQNFAQADEAVRKERDNRWTRVSSSPLPFVP